MALFGHFNKNSFFLSMNGLHERNMTYVANSAILEVIFKSWRFLHFLRKIKLPLQYIFTKGKRLSSHIFLTALRLHDSIPTPKRKKVRSKTKTYSVAGRVMSKLLVLLYCKTGKGKWTTGFLPEEEYLNLTVYNLCRDSDESTN